MKMQSYFRFFARGGRWKMEISIIFFELFLLVATLNPVYFVALLRRSYSQTCIKNGNSFAFAKQGGEYPLTRIMLLLLEIIYML